MIWIFWVFIVLLVFKCLNFFTKYKIEKETRDFFKDSKLKLMETKGYLNGFGISPLEEEKIITECKISADFIDRRKLIIWLIAYCEKQKRGSGRKFLNLAGFRNLDDLDYFFLTLPR